jgi:hypothetical protein
LRNGTTALFAALDVLTGNVIGECRALRRLWAPTFEIAHDKNEITPTCGSVSRYIRSCTHFSQELGNDGRRGCV